MSLISGRSDAFKRPRQVVVGDWRAETDDESDSVGASSRESDSASIASPPAPSQLPEERIEFSVYELPRQLHEFQKVSKEVPVFYSYLMSGARGAAELFAFYKRDSYCSCGDTIWTFDNETLLWTSINLETWGNLVSVFVLSLFGSTVSAITEQRNMYRAMLPSKKDTPYIASWTTCIRNLQVASKVATSLRGADELAKMTRFLLKSDDFLTALDNVPTSISFRNGVLNPLEPEIVPRTREQLLTYALSYDYEELTEDHAPAKAAFDTFMTSLFPDARDLEAFQAMTGYWILGRTHQKAFWQIAAPSHCGKTTLLSIVLNAMERYGSIKEVPIEEMTSSKFEDALAQVFSRTPRCRLLVWDEIGADVSFKEDILNQLSDGKEGTKLSFRGKGEKPLVVQNLQAKLVFLTNHVLKVPASATGLLERNKGIHLYRRFLPPDGTLGPDDMHSNPDLERLLMSQHGKLVVARFMVEGAKRVLEGASLSSPNFERASFELRIKGDVYLQWLTDKYRPTSLPQYEVRLEALVRDYKADGRDKRTESKAYEGFKDILDNFPFTRKKDIDDFGTLVRVYTGLRPAHAGDLDWVEVARLVTQILAEST